MLPVFLEEAGQATLATHTPFVPQGVLPGCRSLPFVTGTADTLLAERRVPVRTLVPKTGSSFRFQTPQLLFDPHGLWPWVKEFSS